MDPHSKNVRYYLYDYFATTLQTDLERFPPSTAIESWMLQAGFREVDSTCADHLQESFIGKAVFEDPFLRKEATSQLTLLSDAQYQAGLTAIRQAIEAASQTGRTIHFPVDIEISMITGFKGMEV
jgi:hypothetical protein